MSPPATLAAAAKAIAERLIDVIMALLETVAVIDAAARHAEAARSLIARLTPLVLNLDRLRGAQPRTIPTPADPAAEPEPAQPQPGRKRPPRPPIVRLPRRPGWIIEALPDAAPYVAEELARILADPAYAKLLAASPTVARALRPLLRGLGLPAQPAPPPPPPAAPPIPPHRPTPTPRSHLQPATRRTPPTPKTTNPPPPSSHALSVTIT